MVTAVQGFSWCGLDPMPGDRSLVCELWFKADSTWDLDNSPGIIVAPYCIVALFSETTAIFFHLLGIRLSVARELVLQGLFLSAFARGDMTVYHQRARLSSSYVCHFILCKLERIKVASCCLARGRTAALNTGLGPY